MRRSTGSLDPVWACLISVLVVSSQVARAAPESPQTDGQPQNVLVIFPDNPLRPANRIFDESLRAALGSGPGRPIECHGEFLDEVDYPARYPERMHDLLLAKYGDHPADLVVAFTSPSLDFCLDYRSQLFPGIPIVFAGFASAPSRAEIAQREMTGVRASFDLAATLRLALHLHPRARQVFLITGPGRIDPDPAGRDSSDLFVSQSPVPVHRLTADDPARLLEKLANLPQNSLVIDPSGIEMTPGNRSPFPETMQRMSDVCPAPIYGIADPLVGEGLVGAVTTPIDSIGTATAKLVLALLSGESGEELPPVRHLAAVPLVDWRQLERWEVRQSRLPPARIVRFKPPSFWRQHLLLIITTGALILLQSGLILSLVLQSRRRRRAELEARRRREELAHMTRVATIGELTASLAHEINQPLAAIVSNAQAAQRLLNGGEDPKEEIQEILADIVADDLRAGEVIRRMRTLLRKGEFHPTELDLNELVAEVVGLVHGEMVLHNVSLDLELSPRSLPIHGDRVQLQQVLLNLMINALDATKEVAQGARRVIVRTAAADERSFEVAIQDSGVGLPTQDLEQIFEPFYTTKPHGLGLGLPICRSIIQAHGGRIGSRNNAGRGATSWFHLPASEEWKR